MSVPVSVEHPVDRRSTREVFLWCTVVAAASAARVAVAFRNPGELGLDADGYLAHAAELLKTGSYSGPYSDLPTAFRPPGYPVLLAAFQFVGCTEWASVLLISLLATLAIAYCLWKTPGCDLRRFGLIATGIAMFDPLLFRYSLLPMTEVPCAAALMLAVFVYCRCCAAPDGRSSTLRCIVAGLFFSAATLIRPTVAVCVFLILLAELFAVLVKRTNDRRTDLRRVLTVGVMFVVGLCPWIVRNYLQFQRIIPATTHGGYTLALGNNPDFYRDVINGKDEFPWEGASLERWQRRTLEEAKQSGTDILKETELDAWYSAYAKAAMKENPSAAFKATRLRLRRFWALSTAESKNSFLTTCLSAWYGTLWLGLIMWVVFSFRIKLFVPEATCALCVLAFVLMHTVYWTDTRMRTPVMPLLILLSVMGWSRAGSMIRSRR
ncbi:MAG: glycosyltransferase family 39 protein [Planctomycetaceae bacterium]|nr:glycosyltransferase family 39 protein [Planctomycetaceae bacterium]